MESDKSLKDVNFGFFGNIYYRSPVDFALSTPPESAREEELRAPTDARAKIPIFIVISVNFFANKLEQRAEKKGERRRCLKMPRRGVEIYSVSRIYFDKEMEGKHKRTKKCFPRCHCFAFFRSLRADIQTERGKNRKAAHLESGKAAATSARHRC
jgi:hypothetical protein